MYRLNRYTPFHITVSCPAMHILEALFIDYSFSKEYGFVNYERLVKSMKHVPNLITGLRILSSLVLLFLKPLSTGFFAVYTLCGVSDILDGYVARKTGTAGKAGAVLDSVADMVFIAVALVVFIPVFAFAAWMVYWTIAIALIRLASLAVGFIRYRSFASLHTYANKATGLILFCFPLIYQLCGSDKTAVILLAIASLSAIEEILINMTAPSLNREVKSIVAK